MKTLLKRFAYFIGLFTAASLVLYLVGSFAVLSWDINKWESLGRILVAILTLGITGAIFVNTYDEIE